MRILVFILNRDEARGPTGLLLIWVLWQNLADLKSYNVGCMTSFYTITVIHESGICGALGGYPNIYHSADGTMPQHFTFDLGRIYEGLSSFESAGRQDCPCHNPDKLEVWGIADTTNAITTLASNDPGWAAQSVSKGWTLLTTVERNDNGIAPYKVDITPGKPPVRFIRIRILHVIDDHASESHLSEVSFWIKP